MFASKETPFGRIGIEAENGAVTALELNCERTGDSADPLIREAFRQLEEFFAGKRTDFELPLAPAGTLFQKKVWEALRQIPYGATATYKEIATAVGNPDACRAVGLANNRNPIAIIIPCHRVIGSNRKLVGYAGGLELKQRLLDLEAKRRNLFEI